MNVKIKNITKTKKKLTIDVPLTVIQKCYSDTVRKIGKTAKIKGFRPGKIPPAMIEKYYGHDIALENLGAVVNESYSKALIDNNLHPLLEPKFLDLNPVEKDKEYKFEVEIEVKPEFEIKNYFDIPVKKKNADVKDSEVEAELKKLLESRAELVPAENEKKLIKGLIANIDFEGTIDGIPFEGGTVKGHQLEYGAGHFLKDFEAQIDGLEIDEERDINVKFPDDYFEKKMAGKRAKFHVKLNALHIKHLPALDDEFAKDLGKDSIDIVKKEMKDVLIRQKEQGFKHEYSNEIMETLIKKNKIDIPEGIIEAEIRRSEEQGNKKEKEDVEKSVRGQFIIEAIAEKEGVKVEPDEVEKKFVEMSRMYRQPASALKAYYAKNNLVSSMVHQIMVEKTLDLLLDKAKLA